MALDWETTGMADADRGKQGPGMERRDQMQRKTEKRDEERKQTRTYRRTESESPRRRRRIEEEGRGGGREGTEKGKGTRGHIERFERRVLGARLGPAGSEPEKGPWRRRRRRQKGNGRIGVVERGEVGEVGLRWVIVREGR
jgi:hypothetical protein